MSGYLKTNLVARIIAASFMGFASVIGAIAITFLALAFVDAGADLSLAVVLGLLVSALFVAAFLITRALTEPPRGWAALFVGLGGCAGMLLSELLARTVGYPFSREPDAIVICFLLTAVGAFLGTHAHAPGPRHNHS
jgi:hypothetical protein